MVSTTDAHGMARQVERERELLAEADIDADDREAIELFADHREMNEGVAPSTLRADLSNLRRAAERAEKPLLAFKGLKDTNALLKTNRDEHGLQESSNDNYRKAFRVFFAWLDDDPDHDGYEWWEDVFIPSRKPDPLDPKEVLSMDEVRELRRAADHTREKALIEFLADTGMRITACLQLVRGDIDGLNSERPTVSVNREGEGQKGMDPLPRPIIHSQKWLRTYLNEYHPDDHPDAAVFVTKRYNRRERENGAIHPTTTLNKLKDLAEVAGIDRDRVSNHAFRHVATTRMRREMGMDWDDIGHRTGWSARSLSRMKELYGHLTNEDKNERVWQAADRDEDDSGGEPGPAPECSFCGTEMDRGERYCGQCGADQEEVEPMIPLSDADGFMFDAMKSQIEMMEEFGRALGVDVYEIDGFREQARKVQNLGIESGQLDLVPADEDELSDEQLARLDG